MRNAQCHIEIESIKCLTLPGEELVRTNHPEEGTLEWYLEERLGGQHVCRGGADTAGREMQSHTSVRKCFTAGNCEWLRTA